MNKNNTGRTFWDLVSENYWRSFVSFSILLTIIVIGIYLISKDNNIKTDLIEITNKNSPIKYPMDSIKKIKEEYTDLKRNKTHNPKSNLSIKLNDTTINSNSSQSNVNIGSGTQTILNAPNSVINFKEKRIFSQKDGQEIIEKIHQVMTKNNLSIGNNIAIHVCDCDGCDEFANGLVMFLQKRNYNIVQIANNLTHYKGIIVRYIESNNMSIEVIIGYQ